MEKILFVCRRCLVKFEARKRNHGHYWIAVAGLVILWKGTASVFPGWSAAFVALLALGVATKAIRNTFGTVNACPSCKCKDIIPENSPAGLELKEKSQVFEGSVANSHLWARIGVVAGIVGLLLVVTATIANNRFLRDYNYKECMAGVDAFEKNLGYDVVSAIKRQKIPPERINCERILGGNDSLPAILAEGTIRLSETLSGRDIGHTIFIVLFDDSRENFPPVGAIKFEIHSHGTEAIPFQVDAEHLAILEPRLPFPKTFVMKARIDRDGVGGKEGKGDITGFSRAVRIGERNIEIVLDKYVD